MPHSITFTHMKDDMTAVTRLLPPGGDIAPPGAKIGLLPRPAR